ncbi:hypothetical protein EPI10_030411 [Gossypium australe]|uniref:Uncharacterized protein n=1 Tax=Gossypium australe TaxID=47621 RepID=A0A5B6WYG8_9ROSI|nr:hypothetical protein EPI10_030411 [Gossypium australe]
MQSETATFPRSPRTRFVILSRKLVLRVVPVILPYEHARFLLVGSIVLPYDLVRFVVLL